MPRLILLAAIAVALYLLVQRARSAPPDRRRGEFIRLGLGVALAVVIVLALTGRLHWIGVALAGLLVLLRQLTPLLVRLFPLLATRLHGGDPGAGHAQGGAGAGGGAGMSREEALAILGLGADASEEDIVAAHRRLIQKLHPDRGGNDYLAARINEARDRLLG